MKIVDKKSRLVVYTALFGDYDILIDPIEKFEGCDFVCFSDQKELRSDIWEIRLVDQCNLSSNMMNRKYKLLPHLYFSEYESSLYVDSNIAITKNPIELSNKYLGNCSFCAPKHALRDCVYNEAVECIILKKEKKHKVVAQLSRYLAEGLPKNVGLTENNILLRKHLDASVIKLMVCWWEELNKETQRDQLSLPYALWKTDFKMYFMNESSRNGYGFFEFRLHKKYLNRGWIAKAKDVLTFSLRRRFIKKSFLGEKE